MFRNQNIFYLLVFLIKTLPPQIGQFTLLQKRFCISTFRETCRWANLPYLHVFNKPYRHILHQIICNLVLNFNVFNFASALHKSSVNKERNLSIPASIPFCRQQNHIRVFSISIVNSALIISSKFFCKNLQFRLILLNIKSFFSFVT